MVEGGWAANLVGITNCYFGRHVRENAGDDKKKVDIQGRFLYPYSIFGAVAQLGERLNGIQ